MKKFVLWIVRRALFQGTVLEADILQELRTFRQSDYRQAMTIAVYPDFVARHVTPQLEQGVSFGVSAPQLISHPGQSVFRNINGHDVYVWLSETGQLSASVELADLQWWLNHTDKIPGDFRGKLIYAWASVILGFDDCEYVPYFSYADKPYVDWCPLKAYLRDHEFACLRP